MTHLFSNIAYAKLNLTFDRELFTEEYDEIIIPNSEQFVSIADQWHNMEQLNSIWKVIPVDKFDQYNQIIKDGGKEINGATHQWRMLQLMTSNNDAGTTTSGAYWRSRNRFNDMRIKDQYANLSIIKWIKENIPNKRIVSIHCVCIDPNSYATIHRDAYWGGEGNSPALDNGFYRDGFVVINLNISSGGSPLLWSLDHEKTQPRSVNEDVYMISDYFFHAVPMVNTLRRQIRISVEPTPELADIIVSGTEVTIPAHYKFQ